MRSDKRFLVIANWKMNKTEEEAAAFARGFGKISASKVETVICPPFTSLPVLSNKLKGSGVMLGAQNMFYEDSGTYTGEISPLMLKGLCDFVIIGHSERRKTLGETDEMVNRKVKKALEHGLIPIVCVGETSDERDAGKSFDVVGGMVRKALDGVSKEAAVGIDFAYEPLWAISKGAGDKSTKTATPQDAEHMHQFIRKTIAGLYGRGAAEDVRIAYGGSVKADSVAQFTVPKNVDGVLVGGASLDPESFRGVVENAQKSLSGKAAGR